MYWHVYAVVVKMFPRDGPSTVQRRLFKREQVRKVYPAKRSDKLRNQGIACCNRNFKTALYTF